MKDEYVQLFVRRPVRRAPIINRGWFSCHQNCFSSFFTFDFFLFNFWCCFLMVLPLAFEGYYARWAALRKLLLQFLKSERETNDKNQTKKQILSLGAGFDTTYFQLLVCDENFFPKQLGWFYWSIMRAIPCLFNIKENAYCFFYQIIWYPVVSIHHCTCGMAQFNSNSVYWILKLAF